MTRSTDIKKIISVLRRHYKKSRAPVTGLSRRCGNTPFQTLVAAILSSRTLDQTTAAACLNLSRAARVPADLQRMSAARIAKLIYPVGFYRVKARQLKALPETLNRLFGGRIPDTAAELMLLPGVGRKIANLVAARAFGRNEICVDVHVHRISNRLGLVRTKDPLATENALKSAVPARYWRNLNHLLVALGQTICRPTAPQCAKCPLNRRGARLCRRIISRA
ncbi:MAG: endonuclease III [Kiritimatiellae bacterium]|nr:endonuclease III [Kiritimatiellia bacterium]